MSTIIARPAESAHYYDKTGAPCYEIENKTKPGTFRATNIKDARKLGLFPSVTEVLKVMAKPGLEQWKQQQLVLAALTLPRLDNEPVDAFAARVIEDAAEHARSAAELGTNIHASIQAAFEGNEYPVEHLLHVEAAKEAMAREWPTSNWTCEKSFVHPLGFGGKVDAYSGPVVIDWKTTGFTADKLPKGYDEHLIQLAAYAFGLQIENATIANVYISTTVPGLVHIVKWSEAERKKGLNMFRLAHELWMLMKDYRPTL